MKNLLIPIDFTKVSKEVLNYAQELINTDSYTPSLLYVSEAFHLNDGPEFGELTAQVHNHPLKEKIKKVATEKINELGEEYFGKGNFQYNVIFGDPAAAINEYIEENSIALTLLGHHSKTQLENFFIGSVTEKVTRLSKSPVLTLTEGVSQNSSGSILGLIDFGVNTEGVWKKTLEIAKKTRKKVNLVTVVEPHSPEVIKIAEEKNFSTYNQLLEETQGVLREKMREIAKNFETNEIDCKVNVEISTDFKTPEMLLNYAKEITPDLVVMGTRRQQGINRIIFGSTAEYFIRRYKNPLFVFKA